MNLKKQFPAPVEVYDWLKNEHLHHLSEKEYRFIVLLIEKRIKSSSRNGSELTYVDRQNYRNIKLKNLGVVSVFDKPSATFDFENQKELHVYQFKHSNPLFYAFEYEAKEKSRYFYLESWFDRGFIPRLQAGLISESTIRFVNLYNGKPLNKRTLFSKDVNYSPANKKEVRQAVKVIKERPYNREAILSHLKKEAKEGHNLARFISDCYCWMNTCLHDGKGVGEDKGIYKYKPTYRITKSGRVSEVGGGLQSCSREMKVASIQGIKDIHNYDLKASQINGLKHQFLLCGLDTSWIDSYLAQGKEVFANRVGLSVDCWKECLLIVVMGGSTNLKKPRNKHSNELIKTDFYLAIESDLDHQLKRKPLEEKVDQKRKLILHELDGLLKPLRKWRAKLKKDYYLLSSEYGRKYKKEILIKNKLGIPYFVKDHTTAQLAACILQGQEAAFIHRLTVLSSEYGFRVIGNEHDGLITIGEIPNEAIERVKGELNINEYDLVEKDIL